MARESGQIDLFLKQLKEMSGSGSEDDYETVAARLQTRHDEMLRLLQGAFGASRVHTIVPGVFVYPLLARDDAVAGYERLLAECEFHRLTFTPSAAGASAVPLPRLEAFQARRVPSTQSGAEGGAKGQVQDKPVPALDASSGAAGDTKAKSESQVDVGEQNDEADRKGGTSDKGEEEEEAKTEVVMARRWYAWDVGNLKVTATRVTDTPWAAAVLLRRLFGLRLERLHVVINAYLEPTHHIGVHADKLISGDPARLPDIHTVTYGPRGSEWRFRVRDVHRHALGRCPLSGRDRGVVVLRPGDAMLMLYEANLLYYHEVEGPVSREPSAFQPRISVTLREMLAYSAPVSNLWVTPAGERLDHAGAVRWLEAARAAHFARADRLRRSCRRLAHERTSPTRSTQPTLSSFLGRSDSARRSRLDTTS